jgi:hypothetical protein
VCESKVLRNIFGSKRDEITESQSILQSKELHDWHLSSNNIRLIR